MEKKLIGKMIDRCLVDYFGDKELSPLSDVEYEALIEKVAVEIDTKHDEDVYAVVHDNVYAYLAAND